MIFTIDKQVPMPSSPFSKNGVTDILRSLEVGDSVVLPLAARKVSEYVNKRYSLKFTSRLEGSGYVRLWRKA